MSEFGEKGGVSLPEKDEAEETYDCKWSSCEHKHKKKIKYPNNGKVKKSGYRERWIKAGMEPWVIYGKLKKRLRKDGGEYKTMTYEYKTQAHHLVPTTLVNNTTTLKKNLVLVDYDCDEEKNGMMLPEFVMDIPLHKLQSHLGNHPNKYMEPIRKELREIEKDYDGICNGDVLGSMSLQKTILIELSALSGKAKQKILDIRNKPDFWPLRSNALKEFNSALTEYKRREKLNRKK